MSNQKRYRIVEGSASSHCCFEYTVVDSHSSEGLSSDNYNKERYGFTFAPVCECFEKQHAESICNALNVMDDLAKQAGG